MRAAVVLVLGEEDEVRVVAAVTVTTGLEFPVVWGVAVEVVVVLETVINIVVVVVDATVLDLSVAAVTPPPGSAPVAEALVEESQVVVTR